MKAYYVTTSKKLLRYELTGAILPPVRWWSTEYQAKKWGKSRGRTILVTFEVPSRAWPLPIRGGAWWTDQIIRQYQANEF